MKIIVVLIWSIVLKIVVKIIYAVAHAIGNRSFVWTLAHVMRVRDWIGVLSITNGAPLRHVAGQLAMNYFLRLSNGL